MTEIAQTAVGQIADVLAGAHEAMAHFTCTEIDTIADALRACGFEADADTIVAAHAEGDEEGDDHYGEPCDNCDRLSPAIADRAPNLCDDCAEADAAESLTTDTDNEENDK